MKKKSFVFLAILLSVFSSRAFSHFDEQAHAHDSAHVRESFKTMPETLTSETQSFSKKTSLKKTKSSVNWAKITKESDWILKATVEKIEVVKARKNTFLIFLKPEQIFKPENTDLKETKPIAILEERLFPDQKPLLEIGETGWFFLKKMPTYTAFKELQKEASLYQLTEHAHFKGEEASEKVFEIFLGKAIQQEKDFWGLIDFYFESMRPSDGVSPFEKPEFNFLQKTIVEGLLFTEGPDSKLFALVYGEIIKGKMNDDAKLAVTTILRSYRGAYMKAEIEEGLAKLFCLSPNEVCLSSAEELEKRKRPIPITKYTEAFQKADTNLRVGLLKILGRHQRQDSIELFEKAIQSEKDEKIAGAYLEALGDLKSKKAEDICLSYAKDPRYYVRLAVVVSLGKLKSENGIWALEEALKTSDPTLITLAAKSLEQIGSQKARQTLKKYYEKEHHGYWEPSHSHEHFLPKVESAPKPEVQQPSIDPH